MWILLICGIASLPAARSEFSSYQCSDGRVVCQTNKTFMKCHNNTRILVMEIKTKEVTSCTRCTSTWWQTRCTCIYFTELKYHGIIDKAVKKQCDDMQACNLTAYFNNKAMLATFTCIGEDEELESILQPTNTSMESPNPDLMKISVDAGEGSASAAPVAYVAMLIGAVILILTSVLCIVYRTKGKRGKKNPTIIPSEVNGNSLANPVDLTNPDPAAIDSSCNASEASEDNGYSCDSPPSYEWCMMKDIGKVCESLNLHSSDSVGKIEQICCTLNADKFGKDCNLVEEESNSDQLQMCWSVDDDRQEIMNVECGLQVSQVTNSSLQTFESNENDCQLGGSSGDETQDCDSTEEKECEPISGSLHVFEGIETEQIASEDEIKKCGSNENL